MGSKRRLSSLSKRADFDDLRANGLSFHVNSWLLVNTKKTDLGVLRIGWTISRQIGPSVVRNRLRRWGREFFRRKVTSFEQGIDLNVVFKRRDKEFFKALSHGEFDEGFEKLVAKLGRSFR